ncbi:MAG TPA: cupin domain-containing protein [Salinarimonas sp.]|jgi:quercetin dioxygenase-like cupin family protein|nr:cupin domain-containing protein [Salinarimonas sp.]
MSFQCSIPAVPTLRQDDEAVRITQWDFPPGAATGWHEHGWPYVVVMLTDAVLRVHDGTRVSEVRLRAGESYRRPPGIRHDVMNGSEHPIAFVEVEVKRPDLLAAPAG